MKSSSRKRVFLIIIGGILLITALNFFQKEVRNFFYLISAPIQKTFWRTGDKVSDFFETVSEMKNLKKENEKLNSRFQELLAGNVALLELKKENEALRTALNIGLQKDFKLTLAQVLGKDISQDSLIIDKGSKDGTLKDLPVINQEKILIGKVDEVYENFSKVMLISHKESSFDAKILVPKLAEGYTLESDREIYGIVKGKGNFKVFLDLIPQNIEVKKGELLVTTAKAGIFPEGLLIGEIKEIKKSDVEPFQQIEISPSYDIKELEHLFLISEFE